MKTGAGGTADGVRRATTTEREVPKQRRSEAIGRGVRKRFLCGPGDAAGSQERPAVPGSRRGGCHSGGSTERWGGAVYPAAEVHGSKTP